MGCGGRSKMGAVDEHAKWAYMNLDDFRSTSCWTPFSYAWVWIYATIGVAVFALDCFTAVNLLILDKWSSEIKPAISFNISKWIFVGTIMFSFALYLYEWARAIRVMRRGGVAESYMDPLAVQVQCMRGKGLRRFLVFASLTKSKKGTDYIAFFVYFQFTSAVRIIFAEGARQFVNAVTIVSVARADLVDSSKKGTSAVGQFFVNIYALWNRDKEEALVLGSMTFTLAIWVISALSLIIAVILYVVFLWHYIPQVDGRLSIYCRRKIDRRLERIVEKKVQAALEDTQRKEQKAAARLAKREGKGSVSSLPSVVRQPTLPKLADYDMEKNADLELLRSNTNTTLPPYTSRANTATEPFGLARQPSLPHLERQPTLPTLDRQPTLPSIGSAPPYGRPPMRSDTGLTNGSNYSSNAPLLQNQSEMGWDAQNSPLDLPPRLHRQGSDSSLNSNGSFRGVPARGMTGSPLAQRGPVPASGPMQRSGLATRPALERNPISAAGSAIAAPQRTATPGGYAPFRSNTPSQMDRSNTPAPRSHTPAYPAPGGRSGTPAGPSPPRSNTPAYAGPSPPRSGTPASGYPSAPAQQQQRPYAAAPADRPVARKVSRQSFARPFGAQDRPTFSSGGGQERRNFTSPAPAGVEMQNIHGGRGRNFSSPSREEEGYYPGVF